MLDVLPADAFEEWVAAPDPKPPMPDLSEINRFGDFFMRLGIWLPDDDPLVVKWAKLSNAANNMIFRSPTEPHEMAAQVVAFMEAKNEWFAAAREKLGFGVGGRMTPRTASPTRRRAERATAA
jgi:hypothetical protein